MNKQQDTSRNFQSSGSIVVDGDATTPPDFPNYRLGEGCDQVAASKTQ